jgi:hypothetical protein
VVWSERTKIGENLLNFFFNFPQLLQHLINVNRNTALQRKGWKLAMFLPTATEQFYLLFYWLTAGTFAFPSGFPIPFENCPEAFQTPLGIPQWIS